MISSQDSVEPKLLKYSLFQVLVTHLPESHRLHFRRRTLRLRGVTSFHKGPLPGEPILTTPLFLRGVWGRRQPLKQTITSEFSLMFTLELFSFPLISYCHLILNTAPILNFQPLANQNSVTLRLSSPTPFSVYVEATLSVLHLKSLLTLKFAV